ncbi:glycoside hydrolase family 95 protein [Aestuariibaculum suncheonense]|uniref:Glycoside hydrolase N-terminal domain-containing protein n=1 Tax=Aestuariibaculum suncheonense TaxID=1028745 RepID=A0A8J6UBG4_9FLAO|nr:glycoside hydrolase family 95 protein [Aestuariibaculum suncheonense]MBD0835442.1 glycoside hydrolase N-terminal domain-containing protein [Aestuariibaculum suncheonense]
MYKTLTSYCFLILLCSCYSEKKLNSPYSKTSNILWYNKPADYFEETLVLGNGKMGASIFGGVNSEKIYLNDATLWSGEPINPYNNLNAYNYVEPVRKALNDENYKLADSLNKFIQGPFTQSYAPLGTMLINFKEQDTFTNYYRELDISNAISKVNYQNNGATFQREYFVSHPDQIMAIHLTSDIEKTINCAIGFESLLKYKVTQEGDILKVDGYAPYHAEPSYRGNMPNAIRFDENRGTRFTTLFKVDNIDGDISIENNTIELKNCSEATIYISIATSFNGFDKNPVTEGLDNQAVALETLQKASKKSFTTLKESHIKDYQNLYNRVSLDLGNTDIPEIPTNERLLRYNDGLEDKNLEELYFNFGRYLLISSSRTKEVPANLQGIWNPYMRPPWSSNYTLNINAQENYWLAEIANLSELHKPLLSYIKNVAETGAITAKTYYGVNGWTACQNSDIWALSNPVGDYGQGDPNWANWNMGGTWLATHLWEHYSFTQDKTYLRDYAYPLMKGAVQFCLEWMVKDENGQWITSPSTSPENKYITSNGYHGATLYGGTADLAMIRELFIDFIHASQELNIEDAFIKQVVETNKNLHPYKIGKKGNLQEWYYDWEDEDPQHRHQSHLFGLYPGHHITVRETPDLAEASEVTLNIKGDETTGWSKGWRINLWARLLDGNHAYKMYRELLKYVDPDKSDGKHKGHGGTYPNLFDAHPPFQIDGNFGGAAAVIEMLVQSTNDTIYLLPALPETWKDGFIRGVCTRGGFEISIEWKDGVLISSEILAKTDSSTNVVFGDTNKTVKLKKGEKIKLNW